MCLDCCSAFHGAAAPEEDAVGEANRSELHKEAMEKDGKEKKGKERKNSLIISL